jgi:fumarate reductase flavoprotein subunit
VSGVEIDDGAASAAAVVIATGGFGANPLLLAELYPEAARAADWSWYIGVEECRGDGLEMGRAAGADIVGHNRGLLLLTPGFGRDLESYPPPWLVYVDHRGRRFIDETTEYSVVSGVVNALPNAECFAIFDEAARLAAKPLPQTVKNPFPNPQWEADRLAALADQGRIFRAGTVEALAEKAGIEPGALAATLERYTADAAAGRDSVCFKPAAHLRPVTEPPFYAVRMRAAIVALTAVGLRIDERARVLTREDRPIEGLFAAGETTGGVIGERYAGGGNSISNAIVYGRIAGVEAARRAEFMREP